MTRRNFTELNTFEKQEVFVYFINRMLEPFGLFLSSVGLVLINEKDNTKNLFLGSPELALNFLKLKADTIGFVHKYKESEFIGEIVNCYYFQTDALIKPNVSLLKQLKPNSRSYAMCMREMILSNPKEYFSQYDIPVEMNKLSPLILENNFKLTTNKYDIVSNIEKTYVTNKLNGNLISEWLNIKPSLELGNMIDSYREYKGIFVNEFICCNSKKNVKKDFINFVKTLIK